MEKPPLWVNVPALPTHFLGRDTLVQELVGRLRVRATPSIAVHGLPGVGKSALAVVLAHHPDLLAHFADGVLWAGLGPTAAPIGILASWETALGIRADDNSTLEEHAQTVRNAIGQQRLLVILDDAWDLEVAQLLRCGGPNCAHLLTTRDLGIARGFAGTTQSLPVPELEEDPAFLLLQRLAPEACAASPIAARSLAQSVGGLPLAMELVGGFLAAPEHSLFPELAAAAHREMADPGRRLQLATRRFGAVGGRRVTLQETIALSFEGLPQPVVDAFYVLSPFAPKPASFDLEAAKVVTGADAVALATLVARSIIEVVREERLALHQVVADVARNGLGESESGSFTVASARHAAYYAALAHYADNLYREGGEYIREGLALFDRERANIDAGWAWVQQHRADDTIDRLLLAYADGTTIIGALRYQQRRERIPQLLAALSG